MIEEDKGREARIAWLMKWGKFTANEVNEYPWCLIDVLTIMEEYAADLNQKLPSFRPGRVMGNPE